MERAGVSEIVGTLILIGLMVMGVVIVDMVILSQPRSERIPALEATITNQSALITMTHQGGDTLYKGQYQILVDGVNRTLDFNNSNGLSSSDLNWSVGQTLYWNAPDLPHQVIVVYTGSGTGGVEILSTRFPWGVTLLPSTNLTTPTPLPPATPPAIPPTPTPTPNPPWYNCLWQYRKNITIVRYYVSGSPTPNFPVYINITNDNDLKTYATSSGYDIFFTDASGSTNLPYEREIFTKSSGSFAGWVQVSGLSSTQNTTIYMYFGISSTFDQSYPSGAWDSYYTGVWHMKDDPDTSHVPDSTSYYNNGTKRGAAEPAVTNSGRVLSAQTYDGSNDRINAGSDSSVDNLFASGGTIEAWIYPTGWGESSYGRIADKGSSTGWKYYLNNIEMSGGISFFHYSSSGADGACQWNTQSSTISLSTWQHIVLTFDKSSISNNPKIYINGVSKSLTKFKTGCSGSFVSDASENLHIGNTPGEDRTFTGRIDEVRVSNTIRSADWINTSYMNQNNPTQFISVNATAESWSC
jgi:hypothetical protein